MALDAFRKLELKVSIQYNNRKLLEGMLYVFGTKSKKINIVVLILDKLEKIGLEDVIFELNNQGIWINKGMRINSGWPKSKVLKFKDNI